MREEFLRRLIALIGRKYSLCLMAEVPLIVLTFFSLLKFDGNKIELLLTAICALAFGHGALNIWGKKNGENH